MTKYSAYGTQLQLGDGATPEVFAPVAYLTNIEGPGVTLEVKDATTHDSASSYREKVVGFLDGGTVDVEGLYDPQGTSHQLLLTTAQARTKANWKVVDVDASETEFAAYITNFRATRPMDGMLGFRATLEVSGPVTFPT